MSIKIDRLNNIFVHEISKIIHEEISKRPNYMDMNMSKLCLIIKRRCMAEL